MLSIVLGSSIPHPLHPHIALGITILVNDKSPTKIFNQFTTSMASPLNSTYTLQIIALANYFTKNFVFLINSNVNKRHAVYTEPSNVRVSENRAY